MVRGGFSELGCEKVLTSPDRKARGAARGWHVFAHSLHRKQLTVPVRLRSLAHNGIDLGRHRKGAKVCLGLPQADFKDRAGHMRL